MEGAGMGVEREGYLDHTQCFNATLLDDLRGDDAGS
jgi:hypothetical protein